MAKTTKYFSTCDGRTVELKRVGYVSVKDFARLGLPAIPPEKVDRYAVAYGGGLPAVYDYAAGSCDCGQTHFVERRIDRPSNPSNHKCGGKCRSARGASCECSCKGANHGAN